MKTESEKCIVVARSIIREVEDLEIDEPCLRLATEYLVRAAMALRSIERERIDTSTDAELAEILDAILDEANANPNEN